MNTTTAQLRSLFAGLKAGWPSEFDALCSSELPWVEAAQAELLVRVRRHTAQLDLHALVEVAAGAVSPLDLARGLCDHAAAPQVVADQRAPAHVLARMSEALAEVARKDLGIGTLETRHHPEHDVHEVLVWHLKLALESAYLAGWHAAA